MKGTLHQLQHNIIFFFGKDSSGLLILAIEICGFSKPELTKGCQGQEVFYHWRLHGYHRDLLSELISLTE